MLTSTLAIRIAAVMGLLAVALGAFGAHGLKDLLAQNGSAKMALDSFPSKIILTT